MIHLANGAPRLAFERAAVAPEGAYAGMQNPNGMNPGGAYAVTPNANGMNPGMLQQKQKGDGRGYGIASLILGIVSVLLFCTCINWVTGILAIIFGIIQITKIRSKVLQSVESSQRRSQWCFLSFYILPCGSE